jgi:hypothetical protein
MRQQSTGELLRRVETTQDALMLWAIHRALDGRDVPPCLRWPRRDESPQLLYVTWLADLQWFCRRNAFHEPAYTRWKGLFGNAVASDKWHNVAVWLYRQGHREPSHYHSKAMGLSDAQRQPLMTLLSNKMRGDRRLLGQLPRFREAIWLRATAHPDPSGTQSAEAIADRRAGILRVFLLAGRSRTVAARYYGVRFGESISRQALTRHVEAIELATKLRLLRSR